jgi:c(7)-type cytochrome triheme protein
VALAVACVAPLLLVALDSHAASPEPALAAFSHRTPAHANVACLQCHRRTTNAATPQLPGHSSCAGCHAQQFADQNNAICATCHTRPPAAPVKAFPRLRTFDARFDHARHRNVGCARCHTPRRNGVALSIPAGFSAHTACFSCHTPRAQSRGRDISSCGTCHRVGSPSRTPESSPAYRVNFSHDEHTDRGLRCADCHRVVAGRGRGRQVTSPAPLQHRAQAGVTSCATCHDDKRAFGGDDFSDCKRCHEGTTWRF